MFHAKGVQTPCSRLGKEPAVMQDGSRVGRAIYGSKCCRNVINMANIIEVPFAEGTILFAAPGNAGGQAFGVDDIIQRAVDGFEDALGIIQKLGEKLSVQLS